MFCCIHISFKSKLLRFKIFCPNAFFILSLINNWEWFVYSSLIDSQTFFYVELRNLVRILSGSKESFNVKSVSLREKVGGGGVPISNN